MRKPARGLRHGGDAPSARGCRRARRAPRCLGARTPYDTARLRGSSAWPGPPRSPGPRYFPARQSASPGGRASPGALSSPIYGTRGHISIFSDQSGVHRCLGVFVSQPPATMSKEPYAWLDSPSRATLRCAVCPGPIGNISWKPTGSRRKDRTDGRGLATRPSEPLVSLGQEVAVRLKDRAARDADARAVEALEAMAEHGPRGPPTI